VSYIAEGLVLGLTLAVLLGPLFVVLIETSMRYGARSGLMVGSGIWFSDILFFLSSYAFVNQISHLAKDVTFHYWVGKLGGFLLITIGFYKLFKPELPKSENMSSRTLRNVGFFGKGFLINTLNPFTFVFWFGIIGSRILAPSENNYGIILTCLTILFVIITTDLTKILGAKWISKRVQSTFMKRVNIMAALVLVLAGLVLLGRNGF
jgi:threonine/homoserine/homoserine lactone efflux protein